MGMLPKHSLAILPHTVVLAISRAIQTSSLALPDQPGRFFRAQTYGPYRPHSGIIAPLSQLALL